MDADFGVAGDYSSECANAGVGFGHCDRVHFLVAAHLYRESEFSGASHAHRRGCVHADYFCLADAKSWCWPGFRRQFAGTGFCFQAYRDAPEARHLCGDLAVLCDVDGGFPLLPERTHDPIHCRSGHDYHRRHDRPESIPADCRYRRYPGNGRQNLPAGGATYRRSVHGVPSDRATMGGSDSEQLRYHRGYR